MFDFHEKRKIRGIVYSRPVVGILLLLTIMLSVSVYHRYTVANEMKDKLYEQEHKLEGLKERAMLLEDKVEYLQDERGIEEELRNRFDVKREGEQVIILIDDKDAHKPMPVVQSSVSTTENNPSFIQRLKFW